MSAERLNRARTRGARRLTYVGACALLLTLAACTSSQDPTVASGNPVAVAPQSSAATAPSPAPLASSHGASAEASASAPATDPTAGIRSAVEKALSQVAASASKPTRQQISSALASAGLDPSAAEISQDRTPTGLDVDVIQAAVVSGKQCVVGQIRDHTVEMAVLPILGTGHCFVGDQH